VAKSANVQRPGEQLDDVQFAAELWATLCGSAALQRGANVTGTVSDLKRSVACAAWDAWDATGSITGDDQRTG